MNLLEKELSSFFERLLNIGVDIEPARSTNEAGFGLIDIEIFPKLLEITKMVGKLKKMTNIQKPGPNFIYDIKELMNTIECKLLIQTTSNQEMLKYLSSEEISLRQDISLIEESVTKSDSMFVPNNASDTTRRISKDDNLLPEVIAFQNFVAKHGHYDGWESTNHSGFLALRESYAGNVLYSACSQKLLRVSYLEAKEHDEWYKEYELKKLANKHAIHRWRNEKQLQKMQELKQVEDLLIKTEKPRESKDNTKVKEQREFQKYQIMLWKKEQAKKEEMNKLEKEKMNSKKPRRKIVPRILVKPNVYKRETVELAPTLTQKQKRDILMKQRLRESKMIEKKSKLLKVKSDCEKEKRQRLQSILNKVCFF